MRRWGIAVVGVLSACQTVLHYDPNGADGGGPSDGGPPTDGASLDDGKGNADADADAGPCDGARFCETFERLTSSTIEPTFTKLDRGPGTTTQFSILPVDGGNVLDIIAGAANGGSVSRPFTVNGAKELKVSFFASIRQGRHATLFEFENEPPSGLVGYVYVDGTNLYLSGTQAALLPDVPPSTQRFKLSLTITNEAAKTRLDVSIDNGTVSSGSIPLLGDTIRLRFGQEAVPDSGMNNPAEVYFDDIVVE